VVDSIEHYWNLIRDLLRLQDLEESQLVEYHREISKIFSAQVFNQMLPSKQTKEINKLDMNPKFMSEDDQRINDLAMKIVITKGNRLYQVETLNELKQSAEILIVLIEKEYHLQ
jgi:hypothetical protein